ncbi:hypothetical protein N9045_01945 [bacterium]|nr:hypothetical protein [bacterium]
MRLTNMLKEIGDDADLLTRSDEWLEGSRKSIAQDLDIKLRELKNILLAQKIKSLLQSKNLVAVQQLLKDDKGNLKDIIVRLMKLPDAVKLMDNCKDISDKTNAEFQFGVWHEDGYDIDTSRALR